MLYMLYEVIFNIYIIKSHCLDTPTLYLNLQIDTLILSKVSEKFYLNLQIDTLVLSFTGRIVLEKF